ncbi:MAG TPA: hypothetical protein ENN07_03705 [candidate division Zixibacteria bacterium]|nr:hypothetical protein [candidate division Zixibacteria bacterium]
MKKALLLVLLIAITLSAAEDVTESTPPRLGPAVGIMNAPLAIGYRIPTSGYRSIDFAVRIPEFYKNDTGGVGFSLGALAGYNIPMRIEENIAFVVKPQFDIAFSAEDFKAGDDSYHTNTISLRPGAFMGVEVFLEEVGVSDVNIALGFTTGMELNIVDSGSSSAVSTFHVPKATWPFGATVAVWWYF